MGETDRYIAMESVNSQSDGRFKDVFLARQPIFTRALTVYGYELLYRPDAVNGAGEVNGNQATSQVLINAFMEIGFDNLVGDRLAFINFTQSFLESDESSALPRKQVVLEVLEDVRPTPALIQALQALSSQGFSIALDDFVYREELDPLVDIADIIKVDVRALDDGLLEQQVRLLKPRKAELLAEKIETHEEFVRCKDLGFDYFQGYFFARPLVVKGKRLPANRLAVIRLLARLQDPAVEVKELELLIGQDLGLSYKLLRYINSPYFGLRNQVSSIQQAIVLIGLKAVKTWATLIGLSGIDDKPGELMVTAMVRAKLCEALAQAKGLQDTDVYFTVGLFSIIDAILDAPMAEIIAMLPLSDEVQAALLSQEGVMGTILKGVLAYEKGEWDESDIGIDRHLVRDRYLQSIRWADDTLGGLLDRES